MLEVKWHHKQLPSICCCFYALDGFDIIIPPLLFPWVIAGLLLSTISEQKAKIFHIIWSHASSSCGVTVYSYSQLTVLPPHTNTHIFSLMARKVCRDDSLAESTLQLLTVLKNLQQTVVAAQNWCRHRELKIFAEYLKKNLSKQFFGQSCLFFW